MTDKHGSAGGSEQKQKEQRDESAAAVPSSVASRAAHAVALSEQARLERLQLSACSKLARFLSTADSRPLDQRAADVFGLLSEDDKRDQPLLNLSHKLAVSMPHCNSFRLIPLAPAHVRSNCMSAVVGRPVAE